MKISDANIIAAVKELKVPYYCKKCKSQHKVGTKVWSEHLQYIDASKVLKVVKNKAAVLAKQSGRRGREFAIQFGKQSRARILKNYTKLLKMIKPGRYYGYEAGEYSLSSFGKSGGYKTVEELMRDEKWTIESAKKGERIVVILKATPYKIIKARELGMKIGK